MASGKKGGEGPITIKKYANRRLYNTATSSYVTLEHLRDMVKEGVEFSVFDAKTGEDGTLTVAQAIEYGPVFGKIYIMLGINELG